MKKKYKFSKFDMILIENFVFSICEDIKVKKSKQWLCDQDEQIVYIGTKAPSKTNEYFIQWFKNQNYGIDTDINIISLLHEIGHIMSGFDSEKIEERAKLNNLYVFLQSQGAINVKEMNYNYYEIPEEKSATEWGVNYYKNHQEQCEKLAEDLGLYNLE